MVMVEVLGGGGLVTDVLIHSAGSVCVMELDLLDLTLRVCSVSPEMNTHKVR